MISPTKLVLGSGFVVPTKNQGPRTMNYLVLCLFFLLFSLAHAAEIYARKMEILKLPSGQATQFKDSVFIQDAGTLIICRRALLLESRELGFLSDSVIIRTPEVCVWSDSVEYDFHLRRAHILAHPDKKVVLKQESLEIKAPEIEYFFQDGNVYAPSGLELTAQTNTFKLTGKKGIYSLRECKGVIDSAPVLLINSETGKEPVLVTAKKMYWFESNSSIMGLGSVMVSSGQGQITADTALFYTALDSGIAWGNPIVQDSAGRAMADTLIFLLDNRTLKRVIFIGGAQGHYRTVAGDTVLVQGTELNLLFENGKIERITVANLFAGQLLRSVQKKEGERQ